MKEVTFIEKISRSDRYELPVEDFKCPACGGKLWSGRIPCPDGKPGCLVAHFGYNCELCKRSWK